jgi:hypothetical protein
MALPDELDFIEVALRGEVGQHDVDGFLRQGVAEQEVPGFVDVVRQEAGVLAVITAAS